MRIDERGVSEASWVGAVIETGRIMNVNINDWSVDVVSELASKRYFDLQVMSPYFHFVNGEGVYCMPEIGAMVWICKPTQGRFAAPFILGFQAPFNANTGNFQNGRPSLNPGDIMMRTRDENFVVLRRGGVVQIGATPIAQRMYIPIRNFIKDFCENYELHTFGGDLTWETARTDQTNTGQAPTTFTLSAKQFSNDPQPVATLTMGSLGAGVPTILELDIFASGAKGAQQVVTMTMDNAGNVAWSVKKNWNVVAHDDISYESQLGNISFTSDNGNVGLKAHSDVILTSDTTDIDLVASSGSIKEKSLGHIIDAPSILLGGSSANHPLPYGDSLTDWLTLLTTAIGAIVPTPGVALSSTFVVPPGLDAILSSVTKTK